MCRNRTAPASARIGGRCGRSRLSVPWAWSITVAVAVLVASCSRTDEQETRGISRVPVSSSALRSVGYDEDRGILEIEFDNGAVYRYYDVPPEVHRGLMSADSHGRYFHRHIRSAGYRHVRIE